eukprot:scaffold261513_cov14-Tisochrysis_lutea.AAC.1
MGRKRSQPAWMRDNSYECANDAVPKREQAVAGPAVAGPAVARGLAAAVTEPLQVAGGEGEELTPYELERQALIARNRQRMVRQSVLSMFAPPPPHKLTRFTHALATPVVPGSCLVLGT